MVRVTSERRVPDPGSRIPSPGIDGVLVIDKPSGPTSHDVVSVARRLTGIRKIGHTGTLDPLARGVLPLVLGRATRLAQFFTRADKEYEADLRLGARTNTCDGTGAFIKTTGRRKPASLTLAEIESALGEFRGTYLQPPPAFSAKKVSGTPAYRLARRSEAVDLSPVTVTVDALDILGWQEDRLHLRLVSSSGFYVRSLADSLGERLGTGAYLEALLRRRSGEFGLDAALSLDDFERRPVDALGRVIPLQYLLPGLPAVVLTPEGAARASRGAVIGLPHLAGGQTLPVAGQVRLLHPDRRLLAIAQPLADGGASSLLHPGIVLE